MEVFSRGVIASLEEHVAAELGRQLAGAVKLYHARGVAAPYLLEAFANQLNAATGATRGRISAQVSPDSGPGEAAPGRFPARSDEPVMLTVKEAAALGGVHPRTVRKWIEDETVSAVRGPRGAHRIDPGSLAAKISQRRR